MKFNLYRIIYNLCFKHKQIYVYILYITHFIYFFCIIFHIEIKVIVKSVLKKWRGRNFIKHIAIPIGIPKHTIVYSSFIIQQQQNRNCNKKT